MALFTHVVAEFSALSRNVCMGFTRSQMRNMDIRFLYSEAALGVDNYCKVRDRIQSQFVNTSDRFRTKMNEFSEPSSTNMVFTEDLKNMVHLANESDVQLVTKMLRRFNSQNKDLRFGSFIFGPIVMRMFYFLNQPDAALNAFKDPELDGVFDQLISYQLLLDLLFKNEKYQNVLDAFEIIQSKQLQNARHPKNVVILAFAACYKLNSQESLKFATELWKQLQEVGHVPARRAVTFAAALALNQNSPHIALEMISNCITQNYITVRSIKVAALSDLDRLEDAVALLRVAMQQDDPSQRKAMFPRDVVEKVNLAVQREEKKELVHEAQAILKRLKENGHVTETVLDDQLCMEITVMDHKKQPRDKQFIEATFSRTSQRQTPGSYQRPGLRDLL